MSNSPAPKSKTVSVVEVLSTRIYKLYVPTSVHGTMRIGQAIRTLTGIAGGHTFTSSYGAWAYDEDHIIQEPVTCYEFVVTRNHEDFHAAMLNALRGLLECGESCGMCTMQDDKNLHCITVS